MSHPSSLDSVEVTQSHLKIGRVAKEGPLNEIKYIKVNPQNWQAH